MKMTNQLVIKNKKNLELCFTIVNSICVYFHKLLWRLSVVILLFSLSHFTYRNVTASITYLFKICVVCIKHLWDKFLWNEMENGYTSLYIWTGVQLPHRTDRCVTCKEQSSSFSNHDTYLWLLSGRIPCYGLLNTRFSNYQLL